MQFSNERFINLIYDLTLLHDQQTYLWVLNDESEFDFAFNKLKVAGVMTDYPTKLKNYLDSSNAPPRPAQSGSSGNERSELIKKE